MAERRMMAIRIIDDDAFLDLPSEARLLYYDLTMRADDDGFITPKKVMRLIGATQKDLNALVESGFLIQFESGVVAITHWRTSNTLRKDRYTPTDYQEEFSQLTVINGRYERCVRQPAVVEVSDSEGAHGNQLATSGEPDGNHPASNGCQSDSHDGNQAATTRQPVVATGKDRLGKEKVLTPLTGSSYQRETAHPGNQAATMENPPTLEEVKAYFRGNLLKGDPEKFYYTYQPGGWVDKAGIPIRDWKGKARHWSCNENNYRVSPGSPQGSRPRDYDGSYDSHGMKEESI